MDESLMSSYRLLALGTWLVQRWLRRPEAATTRKTSTGIKTWLAIRIGVCNVGEFRHYARLAWLAELALRIFGPGRV